jgi:hypothetical protein
MPTTLGRREFVNFLPGCLKKIKSDTELPIGRCTEFLLHLDHYTGGGIQPHAQDFFERHRLFGTRLTLAGDRFATAQISDRLVKSLMTQGLPGRAAREAIRRAELSGSLARLRVDVGNFFVRRFQPTRSATMWSFGNPANRADPLSGATSSAAVAEFICRIGAGYTTARPPSTVWVMVHKPRRSAIVARPTTFDAGTHNLKRFVLGGQTRPDPRCRRLGGLAEVVHNAIRWNAPERLILWP